MTPSAAVVAIREARLVQAAAAEEVERRRQALATATEAAEIASARVTELWTVLEAVTAP